MDSEKFHKPERRRSSSRRSSLHPKSLTTGVSDCMLGLSEDATPEERFIELQVAAFKAASESVAEAYKDNKVLYHRLLVQGDEASKDFGLELRHNPNKRDNIETGRVEKPEYKKIKAYIEKLENEVQLWHDTLNREVKTCERLKNLKEHVEKDLKPNPDDLVETTCIQLNYLELNQEISDSFLEHVILEKFERQKLRELEKERDLLKKENDLKFEKLIKLAYLEK